MNKATVVAYLKKNQDPRGIEHWKKRNRGSLKSYGIGLTVLRKYAKSIGRDPKLAKSLWNSNIHEMKIISILIDDPKTMAGALMGIGMRTKELNKEALKVARAIGPITHSESCDPFDVAKHLTSDHAKQKLGL